MVKNRIRTHIVIINGTPRSGKDTFVEYARQYCDRNECAWVRNISSVDPIKEVFTQNFGYSEDNKTDIARKALAAVKEMWVDNCNGSVAYMYRQIMCMHNGIEYANDMQIIFLHIREPKEIKEMMDMFSGMEPIGIGITTVLVARYMPNKPVCDADMNVAEYEYHHLIKNDGSLEDLQNTAVEFIEYLLEVDRNE